ncbi:zinc ribbon domain-containing protein [Adlercreutzia sp. ZJ154]|uniref:zinc ribbon domain-containing protein n=1 Tax=Adlercreutzia sp. ZJ154 TaxID=2709790 RepID=UPI0013EDC5DD|nr:hypothetical protein [Adlercreutzia sp. ZJ154]
MEAKIDDLDRLLEVQKYDLELYNLKKQLTELPQPKVIANARTKRTELQKKADQIGALKKDATKRLLRVRDEDESLIKKERGVQAAIDAAGGDYRNIEARSKELAGIAKRRNTLSENRAEIEAELAKISALEAQVSNAIQSVERIEAQTVEEYRREGGAIQQKAIDLERQRDLLFTSIDGSLVEKYRKIAERLKGIAIGELQENRCGVCRSAIEGGRLIDLRNQAPLGVCPSCSRLLIIR